MTMTCKACRHPKRAEIDAAILNGDSLRSIAFMHGLAQPSIRRHKEHLGLGADLDAAVIAKATTALEHSAWLVGQLRELAQTAKVAPRQFLEVADRLDRSLRTYGLLNKEIQPATVQQFMVQLGVGDEGEIRRSLELTRVKEFSAGAAIEDALALLKIALAEQPERLDYVRAALDGMSHAVAIEAETNGHTGVR